MNAKVVIGMFFLGQTIMEFQLVQMRERWMKPGWQLKKGQVWKIYLEKKGL